MGIHFPTRPASTLPLPRWLASHAEAAKRLNPDGKIRRVFYPLGGPDISTPLALFTGPQGGPKEIMIVDALSFGTQAHRAKVVSNVESRRVFFRDYEKDGFASVDHALPKMEVAGVGIEWHLKQLGVWEMKVQHLDASGQPRAERPTHPPAQNTPAENRDVVRVNFKYGGEEKSLLFVQHDIREPLPKVASDFLDDGIDAIFEKAPMGLEWNQHTQRALLNLNKEHGVIAGSHLPDTKSLSWLGARTEAILFRDKVPGGYDTLNAIRLTGLETARSKEDAKMPGAEYWKLQPQRAQLGRASTPYSHGSDATQTPRYPSQEADSTKTTK